MFSFKSFWEADKCQCNKILVFFGFTRLCPSSISMSSAAFQATFLFWWFIDTHQLQHRCPPTHFYFIMYTNTHKHAPLQACADQKPVSRGLRRGALSKGVIIKVSDVKKLPQFNLCWPFGSTQTQPAWSSHYSALSQISLHITKVPMQWMNQLSWLGHKGADWARPEWWWWFATWCFQWHSGGWVVSLNPLLCFVFFFFLDIVWTNGYTELLINSPLCICFLFWSECEWSYQRWSIV